MARLRVMEGFASANRDMPKSVTLAFQEDVVTGQVTMEDSIPVEVSYS